ncbi:MAG: 50S ribosomal protein L5 [Schleiferiaceae bacterium]|jgi:large subunit ribosomal protein L5|nr:50S ribosomal protein L5 [Schleiferiaceae bacterium]MDP4628012.1 50S ribosomal protein L5 [Schleiferiaceae bacterium]MDP4728462.1 50S ribosomal protein L5 [Schleiferiaceae bacterium]MDP4750052.1 50S ribosomal protein L5 [Schleiferiaceae bacterium]MDP4859482.1 50S ribosomal protein L5 [Schleiferiaceae bacterium]
MEQRLKSIYRDKVVPALQEEFAYKNMMEVPRLQKIVLSQGIGAAVADKKLVDYAVEEMTIIAGQRAVSTRSKKDISNFKLRKGMPIGARVTLRGERMYEFFDRLLTASLPRIRDFRGVKEGFDGRGNFTFGITEQIIFPEIDIDKVNRIAGMDITFVTSAKTDKECKSLITSFGFPFKK